jgi:hypothetical protein
MSSRLDEARRRAGAVKRTLAAVSAAGFVALLVGARLSHPGQALPATTPSPSIDDAASDDGFEFGGAALGAGSGAQPSFDTHVS